MKSFYFLKNAERAHPDVQFRYVIYPTDKLPGYNEWIPFVKKKYFHFINFIGF